MPVNTRLLITSDSKPRRFILSCVGIPNNGDRSKSVGLRPQFHDGSSKIESLTDSHRFAIRKFIGGNCVRGSEPTSACQHLPAGTARGSYHSHVASPSQLAGTSVGDAVE